MHKKYIYCCGLFLVSNVFAAIPDEKHKDCSTGLRMAVEQQHYQVIINVKANESCSLGYYTLSITTPDKKQQALTVERDGTIMAVWVEPLNHSKRPSIIIWTQSAGSGASGKLDVYSADKNNKFALKKLAPTDKLVAGYMEHENYTVKNGTIYLSFPIYKKTDPNCCPTGGQAKFKYDFQNNQWIKI